MRSLNLVVEAPIVNGGVKEASKSRLRVENKKHKTKLTSFMVSRPETHWHKVVTFTTGVDNLIDKPVEVGLYLSRNSIKKLIRSGVDVRIKR